MFLESVPREVQGFVSVLGWVLAAFCGSTPMVFRPEGFRFVVSKTHQLLLKP